MCYICPTNSGCSVARSSRLLWEQEVAGSNPATPTCISDLYYFRDVAQPGSAHAWGAWGRRFKSCHPDFNHQLYWWFFYALTTAIFRSFTFRGNRNTTVLKSKLLLNNTIN
jgi:hypothetical protein